MCGDIREIAFQYQKKKKLGHAQKSPKSLVVVL